MNARISALISRFKRVRLIEVAIAIAIIVGVVVIGRMFSIYKEGATSGGSAGTTAVTGTTAGTTAVTGTTAGTAAAGTAAAEPAAGNKVVKIVSKTVSTSNGPIPDTFISKSKEQFSEFSPNLNKVPLTNPTLNK